MTPKSPSFTPVPSTSGGPPLLVPAVAFAVLTFVGAAFGARTPRPGDTAAQVLAYDQAHPTVMGLSATLLFASAIPLVIWAVTVYRRLGIRAPGPLMAIGGAVLAGASISLCGLFTWTAGQTAELNDPHLAQTLTTLAFATGAAGFVAPFGLLLAGVAVPTLILKLLPRAVAVAGLVIAVVAMGSTLTLLNPAVDLDLLLPIGRFGGTLWMIVASVLLASSRPTSRPLESPASS